MKEFNEWTLEELREINNLFLRVSDMDGCTLKQIEHEVFETFLYINIDYICAAIRWYSGYYLRPII